MQEFEYEVDDHGDGGSKECEESEQEKFVSGDAPTAVQCSNSHGPDPSLLSTPLPAPVRDPGHSPSGGPLARAAPAPDPPPSVEAAVACTRAVTAAKQVAEYAVMAEFFASATIAMGMSVRPWWEFTAEERRAWENPFTDEEADRYVHPTDEDGYDSEEWLRHQHVEPWDDDFICMTTLESAPAWVGSGLHTREQGRIQPPCIVPMVQDAVRQSQPDDERGGVSDEDYVISLLLKTADDTTNSSGNQISFDLDTIRQKAKIITETHNPKAEKRRIELELADVERQLARLDRDPNWGKRGNQSLLGQIGPNSAEPKSAVCTNNRTAERRSMTRSKSMTTPIKLKSKPKDGWKSATPNSGSSVVRCRSKKTQPLKQYWDKFGAPSLGLAWAPPDQNKLQAQKRKQEQQRRKSKLKEEQTKRKTAKELEEMEKVVSKALTSAVAAAAANQHDSDKYTDAWLDFDKVVAEMGKAFDELDSSGTGLLSPAQVLPLLRPLLQRYCPTGGVPLDNARVEALVAMAEGWLRDQRQKNQNPEDRNGSGSPELAQLQKEQVQQGLLYILSCSVEDTSFVNCASQAVTSTSNKSKRMVKSACSSEAKWIVIRDENGRVQKKFQPSYCGYAPHRKHSKKSRQLAFDLCKDSQGTRLKELCADEGFLEAMRSTGLSVAQVLPRSLNDFFTESPTSGFLPLPIPEDEARLRLQRFEERREEKLAIALEEYEHLCASGEFSAWEESQVRYNEEVLEEMSTQEQQELAKQKARKDKFAKIQSVLEHENQMMLSRRARYDKKQRQEATRKERLDQRAKVQRDRDHQRAQIKTRRFERIREQAAAIDRKRFEDAEKKKAKEEKQLVAQRTHKERQIQKQHTIREQKQQHRDMVMKGMQDLYETRRQMQIMRMTNKQRHLSAVNARKAHLNALRRQQHRIKIHEKEENAKRIQDMLAYKRHQSLEKLKSQDLHYRQMKQLQAALMDTRRCDEAQQLILRHKLRDHNANFEKNYTPGPGSYEIKPITKGGVKIGTGNPKGYMDWAEYNGARVPGPTDYEPAPVPEGHKAIFGSSSKSGELQYAIRHANDTPGPAAYGNIAFKSTAPATSMGGQSVPKTDVDVKCGIAKETPAPGATIQVNAPQRLTVKQMRQMLTEEKHKYQVMSVKKHKQITRQAHHLSATKDEINGAGKNLSDDLTAAISPSSSIE